MAGTTTVPSRPTWVASGRLDQRIGDVACAFGENKHGIDTGRIPPNQTQFLIVCGTACYYGGPNEELDNPGAWAGPLDWEQWNCGQLQKALREAGYLPEPGASEPPPPPPPTGRGPCTLAPEGEDHGIYLTFKGPGAEAACDEWASRERVDSAWVPTWRCCAEEGAGGRPTCRFASRRRPGLTVTVTDDYGCRALFGGRDWRKLPLP